jgi:hypothetical protein
MNNWNSMRARVFAAALIGAPAFAASNFVQHNLVADTDGIADNTDPNLVGSWGISASPASRIWVSNTSNGLATEYNTAGVGVTAAFIPPSSSSKLKSGLPTGQVWSGYGTDFLRLRRASRQTLSSPHWTARFPATTGVPLRSWWTTAPMARSTRGWVSE